MTFKSNSTNSQTISKWLFVLFMFVLFQLAGCAAVQSEREYYHGLFVDNKGDTRIYDVVIKYGAITRNTCELSCAPRNGGGGWTQDMPIPETMQVSWRTEDKAQHTLNFIVRRNIVDARRLASLDFKFDSNTLKVIQSHRNKNPNDLEHNDYPLLPMPQQ